MNSSAPGGSRIRSYVEFVAAVLYFFLVRSLAHRSAISLANESWSPLLEQAMLAILLVLGFAGFGFFIDQQQHPVRDQGLPLRLGWQREAGLGMAMGWGVAVVCVLPLTVVGGIAIVLSTQSSSWGWFLADGAFFALAALAEEVAFRGYGFQRFMYTVGPIGATLGFAAFYAIMQAMLPGASTASLAVSLMFSVVLSTAYLRTRALWLGWGLNFAWKASRALMFGLAVSGVNSHSPVVEGDPMGPFWLTGGGFGLDGSWVSFAVLLLAIPVLFRVTRDLDFLYNAPVIVAGGIPVDLDAAARQQHEAAMGPTEAAATSLVQILPISTQASASPEVIQVERSDEPR